MNVRPPPADLPVAVLISGGGTTLANLLRHIDDGNLAVDVRLVIASTAAAGGLRFARDRSIETLVVDPADCQRPEQFSSRIFDPCRDADVAVAVMGGFLKHVLIPGDFVNRVTNIHPALIPAFCGRGFYGLRVHRAVLQYGAKVSGCTVHFVDDQYDHGPIILQRVVPVDEDDTPERLAQRVFAAECEAYPAALHLIAQGRVAVDGRNVRIAP